MELPTHPVICCFIGKHASGKSYAIRSIMKAYADMKHYKFGLCITKTKFNDAYSYLPEKYVWGGWDEARFEQYIEKLRAHRAKTKKPLVPNFVIWDDLLGTIQLNSSFVSNFVATTRHTSTSLYVVSQYLVRGIGTTMRESCNYAYVFRTVFKSSLEALYDAFGQLCENFEQFKSLLLDATEKPYHCLVYQADKDKSETYSEFCAPETADFKLEF